MVLSSFLSSTRSTVGVLMFRVRHLHLTHLQMMMMVPVMGCTQIPISTLSHIWVFVRLYGIVYVIIVIIIIIIIMII